MDFMKRLAVRASQCLRFQPKPFERDRCLAIAAHAIPAGIEALQGLVDRIELVTVDVRDRSFNLVRAGALGRVVGVLQKRLACRIDLRQALQLRLARAFQLDQPGLQQVCQCDALFLRKVG